MVPRVVRLYRKGKSTDTIRAMLQNTPTELYQLYTGLLGLIEDQEKAQCLHFMQWICFSIRPLTVRELRFALALNPDISHTSIHQSQISEFYVTTDEDMKPVISDLSKGLAEVQQYGSKLVVQFIHQSVQDFLLEKGFKVLNSPIAGNIMGYGHLWLSRSCIEYLFKKQFQDPAKDSAIDLRQQARLAERRKSNSLGLFRYCSEYWFSHICMVEKANILQDHLAALSTKASDVMLGKYFGKRSIMSYHDKESTTLLNILTERNFINIGRAVLTRTVRADQTDAYGQPPLSIAAEKGHVIFLELLLGRDDVDVNHKNPRGDTPLILAVAKGLVVAVMLLLSRADVDVNCKDISWNTPLSWAATNGNEAVVEVLLNREDVDLNSVNYDGDTPLSKAAMCGRNAVVRMLLIREDVDVDYKNSSGYTPLCLAAFFGHYNAVELLLQHNVDVNSRDISGRSVLYWAIDGYFSVSQPNSKRFRDYKNVVDLLLSRDDILINGADEEALKKFQSKERRREAMPSRLLSA